MIKMKSDVVKAAWLILLFLTMKIYRIKGVDDVIPQYEKYITEILPANTVILDLNVVTQELFAITSNNKHRLDSITHGNRTYNSLPLKVGSKSTFMLCRSSPVKGPTGYFCIDDSTWQLKTTTNYQPTPNARERIQITLETDSKKYSLLLQIRSPCEVQEHISSKMTSCQPQLITTKISQYDFLLSSDQQTKTFHLKSIKLTNFPSVLSSVIIRTGSNEMLLNKTFHSDSVIIFDIPPTGPETIVLQTIVPKNTKKLTIAIFVNGIPLSFPVGGNIVLEYYVIDLFCNQWDCVENYFEWIDVVARIPTDEKSCINETNKVMQEFSYCDADFSVSVKSSNLQPSFGDSISLQCDFNTFLPHNVTWYHLIEQKEEKLTEQSDWLNITKITYGNVGYYKCQVVTPGNKYIRQNPTLYYLKLQDTFMGKLSIMLKQETFVPAFNDINSNAYKSLVEDIKQKVEELFNTPTTLDNAEFSNIHLRSANTKVLVVGDFSMMTSSPLIKDKGVVEQVTSITKTIKETDIIDNPTINDVILNTEMVCHETEVTRNGYSFIYPVSTRGQMRVLKCPESNTTFAMVRCEHNPPKYASWSELNDKQCVYPDPTKDLVGLTQVNVTVDNVGDVCDKLMKTSFKMISAEDISLAAETLENVGDLVTSSQDVTDNVMTTIDNVLSMPTTSLLKSQEENRTTERILDYIGLAGEEIARQGFPSVNKTKFALAALMINPKDFQGLHADAVKTNSFNQIKIQSASTTAKETKETKAELLLPDNLLTQLGSNNPVPLVIMTYSGSELFGVVEDDKITNQSKSAEIVNTQVLSAEVRGHTINNLDKPIEMMFRALNSSYLENKKKCVYWDIKTNAWSDEGCYLYDTEGEVFTCHCYHLTNFAVLFNAIPPTNIHADILTIITYVGLAFSMFGAFVTLLIHIIFRNLRDNIPPKILMNLCAALLLMNILFLIAVEKLVSGTGCSVIALFLQYFFLCVFSWSAVEGFHSARGLVFPMRVEISSFVQKAALFGWGIPIILTGIGAGISYDQYGDEESCVVRGKPFFITVLIPIAAVLLFNFVALVTIFCSIRQSSSSKYSTNSLKFKDRLRIIMAFMILFGLTWVFGILVISNDELTFQYLFCILSAFQGLYIFLFYVVRNKRIRSMCKGLISGKSIREVQRSTTRRGQYRPRAETVESTVFSSTSDPRNNYTTPDVKRKIGNF